VPATLVNTRDRDYVSNSHSVPQGCGFFVTPEGVKDRQDLPTCACVMVFEGGLVLCRECGTVYSTLAQMKAGQTLRGEYPR
jgi:hypothetical protein